MSQSVVAVLIVTASAVYVAWSGRRRERALTRSLWAATARAERAEAEARYASEDAAAWKRAMDASVAALRWFPPGVVGHDRDR